MTGSVHTGRYTAERAPMRGEMGWLDTIEATVARVSALSIESSGERESLLYMYFARGLQRMFFSFAIAG